jgi:hypothetical protein
MEVLSSNKSVFIIIVVIYLLSIYDTTPRHVEARLCSNREGVQIAVYVPAGKRRWSKMVLLHNGVQVPYGIWSRCTVVTLPSP